MTTEIMDGQTNIRVMVVDDHQLIIDGILLMLASQEYIISIGTAQSGEEALEFLADNPTDVVLLDINMPGIGGVQTCKQLRKYHPAAKIIILSMYKEIKLVTSLLRAGAHGYVLKSEGQDEVINAIRTVHEQGSYISDEVQKLIRSIHGIRKRNKKSFLPKLSRREKQILELIAQEYTTQEIATLLGITFNTVESYRKNLLSKLGVRNTAGMMRIALENGLV